MATNGKGAMGPPPRPSIDATPDDEDIDMDDSESNSGSGTESGSGSGDDSESEPALAVTRERRANAGNKMAQLLKLARVEDEATIPADDEEEGEDGYAGIFIEAGEDEEFESGREEDPDVDMSSSSEDEDDGQEGDEESGERELRKQKASERGGKKRKPMTLLQQTLKLRKLKHGLEQTIKQPSEGQGSIPTTPAPAHPNTIAASLARPRKKVERATWLPDNTATRASGRKATIHNKQATHKKLKEHEKIRKQNLVKLEAAEARRKANEVVPMTQEERLAQAAEIEAENMNSVNHWELTELQKQAERDAKLAAMKDRQLDGPVITYWSGPAVWINGKLQLVGKTRLVQDLDATSPVQEDISKVAADVPRSPEEPSLAPSTTGNVDLSRLNEPLSTAIDAEVSNADKLEPTSMNDKMAVDQPTKSLSDNAIPKQQPLDDSGFLDGIEYWASLPQEAIAMDPIAKPVLSDVQPTLQTSHVTPTASVSANYSALTTPSATPTILPPFYSQTLQRPQEAPNVEVLAAIPDTTVDQSQDPPLHELAARSLITLTSFPKLHAKHRRNDALNLAEEEAPGGRWGNGRVSAAEKDRELVLRTLFSIPPDIAALSVNDPSFDIASFTRNKFGYDPLVPASAHPRHNTRYLSKRAQHCAITGQVARYRDPATGLPYASAAAYKSVKKVLNGQGAWSSIFQCWVGEVRPAKGVPTSVWNGTKAIISPVVKDVESNAVKTAEEGSSKTTDMKLSNDGPSKETATATSL